MKTDTNQVSSALNIYYEGKSIKSTRRYFLPENAHTPSMTRLPSPLFSPNAEVQSIYQTKQTDGHDESLSSQTPLSEKKDSKLKNEKLRNNDYLQLENIRCGENVSSAPANNDEQSSPHLSRKAQLQQH